MQKSVPLQTIEVADQVMNNLFILDCNVSPLFCVYIDREK